VITVAQAAIAIAVVPIFSRLKRSLMPAGVTYSVRRLQRPARPPPNASRKNVPRINPWISVHVSRFVNSIG